MSSFHATISLLHVLKDKSNETDVLHLRFRWVSLQLRYICTLRTEFLVEKRLGELPATLRDLYDETYVKQLGGHVKDERLIAEATFRLLLCLKEPLTTKNFLLALQFCGEERTTLLIETILDLCANFVVLDTELDVFRFAHLSVREFLEEKEGFGAAGNHAIAAGCCLRLLLDVTPRYPFYIRQDDKGQSLQRRAVYWNPCHEYSCLYWLFHLHESSAHRRRPPLNALFWTFMLDDQNSVTRSCLYWVALINVAALDKGSLDGWDHTTKRLTCGELFELDRNVCAFACLMSVASAWNFCDVLEYCISIDSNVVRLTHPISIITPLHIACRYGSVDVVKLLLDNGAGMELVDCGQYSPMREALRNGHTVVVRLLLENGASPNPETSPRYNAYYLCLAAETGSLDIMKALLDAGADVDPQAVNGHSAVDIAVCHGNLAMVRTVLERSRRTNENANMPLIKATSLIRAVLNGDEADLNAILREWPITEVTARYLDVALWRAAKLNREKCMLLLLEKGADINSRFRNVPVLFAAATLPDGRLLDARKFPLVQLLLRHGADPHVTCHNYTLLDKAIEEENLSLARILLDEGADIHQGGRDLDSQPLLHAAHSGSLDAAAFLLRRGADIESRGLPSPHFVKVTPRSALYWARKKEHLEMVQLLLQHGAKDGPDSCPHEHEPGSCPYGYGPGVCPHEFRQVEDALDEPEPCDLDKIPSDEASGAKSEMS